MPYDRKLHGETHLLVGEETMQIIDAFDRPAAIGDDDVPLLESGARRWASLLHRHDADAALSR